MSELEKEGLQWYTNFYHQCTKERGNQRQISNQSLSSRKLYEQFSFPLITPFPFINKRNIKREEIT